MTEYAEKVLTETPLCELFALCPGARDIFAGMQLINADESLPALTALEGTAEEYFEDFETSRSAFLEELADLLESCRTVSSKKAPEIESLTIVGGHGKDGTPENLRLTLRRGEITGLVGPTGAGKSRLLEDIECLAQGDTPTGRVILINGKEPDEDLRFSPENRLVAQLSQNMNFVMDLTVREFLLEHAACRMLNDPEPVIQTVFDCANDLAGEPFGWDTAVTQLSGGQSRALMIADTAVLSDSPVVLIDEIENAGIDRQRALSLLAAKEKIVIVSTHDPLIALSSDRRAVISGGAVSAVIERQKKEGVWRTLLEESDRKMTLLKDKLRRGEIIDLDPAGL